MGLLKLTQVTCIVVVVKKGSRIPSPDPGQTLGPPKVISTGAVLYNILLKNKSHVRIVVFIHEIGDPAQINIIDVFGYKKCDQLTQGYYWNYHATLIPYTAPSIRLPA